MNCCFLEINNCRPRYNSFFPKLNIAEHAVAQLSCKKYKSCQASCCWLFFYVLVITASLNTMLLSAEQFRFYPGDDVLFDVNGHFMHARCSGEGTPVVFFEHGLGGNSLDWAWVQPEIAKVTRTCAVDRAGYGRSIERANDNRLFKEIAAETKILLDQLEIGQMIYVGHSMAGGLGRALEAKHPEMFLGAVWADMIDPHTENYNGSTTGLCERGAKTSELLYQFGLAFSETGMMRILNSIGFLYAFAPINELPADKQDEYKHGLYRAGYFRAWLDEYKYFGTGCADTLALTPEEEALNFPVTTIIPLHGVFEGKMELASGIANLSTVNGKVVKIDEGICDDHVGMLHIEHCANITTAEILIMLEDVRAGVYL